jgi:hypothetical protein
MNWLTTAREPLQSTNLDVDPARRRLGVQPRAKGAAAAAHVQNPVAFAKMRKNYFAENTEALLVNRSVEVCEECLHLQKSVQ